MACIPAHGHDQVGSRFYCCSDYRGIYLWATSGDKIQNGAFYFILFPVTSCCFRFLFWYVFRLVNIEVCLGVIFLTENNIDKLFC